jgi:hypothetical protein
MDETKSNFSNDMADFFLSGKITPKVPVMKLERPEPASFPVLPIKRKNFKQPKDCLEKFSRTLPGFLINYLENNGPKTESDLIETLTAILPDLRNASGSIYKNTPTKCLNGICRMPMFIIENGIWNINLPEACKYRNNYTFRLKKKTIATVPFEKKGLRKTEKIVSLLRSYSSSLAKDIRTEKLVKNPLNELKGTESFQEAAGLVGYERLIGVLQSYSVVSKHFLKLANSQQTSSQLGNIEKEIESIYSKLGKIENHLIKSSLVASKSKSESNN